MHSPATGCRAGTVETRDRGRLAPRPDRRMELHRALSRARRDAAAHPRDDLYARGAQRVRTRGAGPSSGQERSPRTRCSGGCSSATTRTSRSSSSQARAVPTTQRQPMLAGARTGRARSGRPRTRRPRPGDREHRAPARARETHRAAGDPGGGAADTPAAARRGPRRTRDHAHHPARTAHPAHRRSTSSHDDASDASRTHTQSSAPT